MQTNSPVLVTRTVVCERSNVPGTNHFEKYRAHKKHGDKARTRSLTPSRHGSSSFADVETQWVKHAPTLNGGARINRTYRAAGPPFSCPRRCGEKIGLTHYMAFTAIRRSLVFSLVPRHAYCRRASLLQKPIAANGLEMPA